MSKETITPVEYFTQLKKLKNKNTNESLDEFYDASLALLKKYKLFGQKKMIEKLIFIVECVPKEKQLLDLGITTFIYRDDIEEYINTIEAKAVKIIEMKNYPRDIPEEFSDIVIKTKDIFDDFYILFTDYNGKEERKVQKERREKDPILLGVFKNNKVMSDRFYYLGDWIDEYCDLTLEKLIEEAGAEIIKGIKVPENKEQLIEECNNLIKGKNFTWITTSPSSTPNTTTTYSASYPTEITIINGDNENG